MTPSMLPVQQGNSSGCAQGLGLIRAAAALLALLWPACQVAAARPPAVDEIVRIEASYDNGPGRVRDAALDAHLAQLLRPILDANPELSPLTVTVHVLRAPLPAVFCLDNGATYVSTGLMARLANASQLAGLITLQLAAIVRHDDQTLHRKMADRLRVEIVPELLAAAATLGLAGKAIREGNDKARLAAYRKVQAASDAVALQWLQRAGYDPREVPRAVQGLLDQLTREQRFGSADINRAAALAARAGSLSAALPPQDAAARETAVPGAGWWRPAARRFALEIVEEDLNHGRTVALLALLDSVDSADGPGAETAFLRARDLQLREPDPGHVAEVIAAYERCTAQPDPPAAAFRELGFIYRRQGDPLKARLNFQAYLKRAPQAVDAPIIRDYLKGT